MLTMRTALLGGLVSVFGAVGQAQTTFPSDEERFENPAVTAERFVSELARRIRRSPELPSPAEFARQAQTRKTHRMAVQPDPGVVLPAETLYARARPSVVLVGAITRCERGRHWHKFFATGFVLHAGGIVVTNAHVLAAFAGADGIAIMTSAGEVAPLKQVLAADPLNDIAVLEVDARNLVPLPVATTAPIGATVYCLSHPALNCEGTENAFFTLTKGIVANKFQTRFGSHAPVNVVAITADYAKGSSGGPILNEHGAVVGIVCQTQTLCANAYSAETQMTWKFARPVSSLLALLHGEPQQQPVLPR